MDERRPRSCPGMPESASGGRDAEWPAGCARRPPEASRATASPPLRGTVGWALTPGRPHGRGGRTSAPDPPEAPMHQSPQKPTPRQLRLLRQLAAERGETFATPATRRQPSAEIARLKSRQRSSRSERAVERKDLARDLARRRRRG